MPSRVDLLGVFCIFMVVATLHNFFPFVCTFPLTFAPIIKKYAHVAYAVGPAPKGEKNKIWRCKAQ